MATDKPRYNITVDEDLLAEIEKYRYDNRIATRSGATVELLRRGMEALFEQIADEKAQKNKAPTEESAAEALYEILYYYLGRPPTSEEYKAFQSVVPIVCKGVLGAE